MKEMNIIMKAAYEAPVTAVMPVIAEGMLCVSIQLFSVQTEVDEIVNTGIEEVSCDFYGE